MNASNQAYANCLVKKAAPMREITAPISIKIIGTLRHWEISNRDSDVAGVWSILFLQRRAQAFGKIINRAELAQLQRAQISYDCPAIFHRNIRAIRAHLIATVGDHVE